MRRRPHETNLSVPLLGGFVIFHLLKGWEIHPKRPRPFLCGEPVGNGHRWVWLFPEDLEETDTATQFPAAWREGMQAMAWMLVEEAPERYRGKTLWIALPHPEEKRIRRTKA